MFFIKNLLQGIIIGAGAILPGISSGVICVALGIYEKLINSILGFFTNIKENIKFLLPIISGIIIGIVCLGNILNYLYFNYTPQLKIIFVILISLSLPSIYKNTHINKIEIKHVLSFGFAFAFSLYLVFAPKISSIGFNSLSSTFSLFFSGFIMSAGVVIPGISSTIILILIGKYSIYLSAISNLNFTILFPMGLGLCMR